MCDDAHWMRAALLEAGLCLSTGPRSQSVAAPAPDAPVAALCDVPVGAICVLQGQIVGRGRNRREADSDPTAHAEVLALREAAHNLGRWRLNDVTLYVTLEPCPMCAGAIWLARLERLVFGAWDARAGACGSIFDIARDPRLNHRPQVRGGIMESECAAMLDAFFARQRAGESHAEQFSGPDADGPAVRD